MGRLRRSRTHHARRDVQRAARTRVRTKDLDQIQHDLEHNKKKLEVQEIDEDKPGLGQHVSYSSGARGGRDMLGGIGDGVMEMDALELAHGCRTSAERGARDRATMIAWPWSCGRPDKRRARFCERCL